MDDRRRALSSFRTSQTRVRAIFRYCAVVAAALTVVATTVQTTAASELAAERNDPARCSADECAPDRCPRDRDACPLGLVPDGCSCCPHGVCGLGETVECNTSDRPCADNLECILTEDGGEGGGVTAPEVYRCACKEKELACGSDNRTYPNVCQLNEAAAELGYNGTLWMQYWGPCQSVPIIKSSPKSFTGSIGQPAVFDCEIKGYPVPSISWQFTDIHGITKWLPGDDTLIAIQTRGGPDRLTVTSWVQIMEFKPGHVGNYTCLGTNSVDIATASAVLNVRKMT